MINTIIPNRNMIWILPSVIVLIIQIVTINSFQLMEWNNNNQIVYGQHQERWQYHSGKKLLFHNHDYKQNNDNHHLMRPSTMKGTTFLCSKQTNDDESKHVTFLKESFSRHLRSMTLGLTILASSNMFISLPSVPSAFAESPSSVSEITVINPATSSTTLLSVDNNIETKYDGFADYAKENQMEQSDVSCFINKCGDETKELFRNPRGIKGIVCLGQCKGEQSCATRCFAEYGSDNLNNWLSCTIEVNDCVKVPKNIDNSAENIGYTTTVSNFNPKSLIGKWYKTDGLNPNYDLFDCQTNVFHKVDGITSELDMDIFFRVNRPIESGGGYWENSLTEHMVIDQNNNPSSTSTIIPEDNNDMNSLGRTMHTSGKMYGLQFSENWYIIGESDGTKGIPEFKLVAYKGHTLQGNYEGAFVYAKTPIISNDAIPAIRDAANKAGLNFNDFTRIDNTCPIGNSLNDNLAGTGTETSDWIQLVVGEGGVIDWISPGWRGEYKK